MPNYYEKVYRLTQKIPRGKVCTYGIIADFLELGSARMVGWALNKSLCREDMLVPAHRVVNRKGELSGRNHFPAPGMMQKMLEAEGIEVIDNKVIDFRSKVWHPDID